MILDRNYSIEGAMLSEQDPVARCARVIVVGNEKGGSGKSTVAMHISIALLKAGYRVATIDLDGQQKSFTNYIDNRRDWAKRVSRDLEIPPHFCMGQNPDADEGSISTELVDTVEGLSANYDFIVIDTPGHAGRMAKLAHSMADTLVTPLNDSFVDFDLLGAVDPENFIVSGVSHYSKMVDEARQQRRIEHDRAIDWIVVRNRLSMIGTRNKRLVGDALAELSRRLGFRSIDGLAERMIFREFFPRGLTALDDLDETTLGTRPTMSHATARREVATLISAMGISPKAAQAGGDGGQALNAA
jgi:chromosome partitioning protein